LSGGERWYRSKAARSKHLSAPSNNSFKPKPLRGSA
jgi:hypothetical protein